jgi:vancomycin resistance protein YoaR
MSALDRYASRTAVFNAVFFGGFQDVQHPPHQYYISRYLAGRESTVSYPQPDFRWHNDSPYGVPVAIRRPSGDTPVDITVWPIGLTDIAAELGRYHHVV